MRVASAASPERSRSNNAPVEPVDFSAPRMNDTVASNPSACTSATGIVTTSVGVVGTLDALVLLADDDPVLHGRHWCLSEQCDELKPVNRRPVSKV